jgi:uncharacterized protein
VFSLQAWERKRLHHRPPTPAPDETTPEPASPERASPDAKEPTDEPPQDAPTDRGKPNRLASETSPYLLLHAHNPVAWYPWGEEALEKARQENKLIFLSIGYSSCHWCHVMERESFMDDEIAEFLNEHFVCIKVDREERPDIDAIYMTALHVFNQLIGNPPGGGWPLSMFLTPSAEPVFGGTYFPARDGDRGNATGFFTILGRIHDVWTEQPQRLLDDAKTLTRVTKAELETQLPVATDPLSSKTIDAVESGLARQFDPQYGGFGFDPNNAQRPKFPEPANLLFLLDRIQRLRAANEETEASLRMLTKTLRQMALGGIRDHLGGGFHRYSVDRFWSIPHFEKMLYDNAQLALVYARAAQLTGREDFRRVAEETVEFMLREMRDGEGGFYAAIDAESEGVEGKFYRWDRSEILRKLDADQWKLFGSIYQLTGPPNFEDQFLRPTTRSLPGRNGGGAGNGRSRPGNATRRNPPATARHAGRAAPPADGHQGPDQLERPGNHQPRGSG